MAPGKDRPQSREENSLIETSHITRTDDVGAGAGASLPVLSAPQRSLHLSEVGAFITVKARVSLPLLRLRKIQCQTVSIRDIPHTQVQRTCIHSYPSYPVKCASYHPINMGVVFVQGETRTKRDG